MLYYNTIWYQKRSFIFMTDRQKTINKYLQTLTFENFNDQNQNTWVREVTDPYLPGHRNPFIGNGLIGMRIPVEGNPFVYPNFAEPKMAASGTLMYGVYNANGVNSLLLSLIGV